MTSDDYTLLENLKQMLWIQWQRFARYVDDVSPCSGCDSEDFCPDHDERCQYCGCQIAIRDREHYTLAGRYWCSSNCFYSTGQPRS